MIIYTFKEKIDSERYLLDDIEKNGNKLIHIITSKILDENYTGDKHPIRDMIEFMIADYREKYGIPEEYFNSIVDSIDCILNP